MKRLKNKKGSAIITAIGMGIVLLIIIAGIYSFSKYRTQTVIQESRNVKALALAEAGLEVALGELFNNAAFQTHTVKINEQELEWDQAQDRECRLEEQKDHNFKEESSKNGTISGTLGDGKFKVRIGNIPYQDNKNTKAVDESKAYLKIEAMGLYDKTVRRVIAVVNRRYPSREFLMYDGGLLSVVYGQCSDSNTNVFSIGHLYGHEGVEISQVTNKAHSFGGNGTKQKIDHIDAIQSGAGGILFYSDVDAVFFDKKGNQSWSGTIKSNIKFPTNGKYSEGKEQFGELPDELKNATPDIPAEISTWVKDKNSGISIPPKAPAFEQYKEDAKKNGKYYSSGNTKYLVTDGYGNKIDAVYLDFGNGDSKIKRDGNVSNFPSNGIFYSDKDIVIKGNPSKDVSIVSEKNIFVAGDFNQNGTGSGQQKYCYPQDYPSGKNALNSDDYIESYKDDFQKDTKDGSHRFHVAATVIAKERLVFDHRSAVDCCENELYPYLKYELAKAISDQPNESEAAKVLSPNDCSGVSITASDSVDGFKANIATFTKNFNIEDSSLTSEMEKVYNSTSNGKFKDSDLDKLTEVTWKAFKKDYTGGNEYSGSVTSNDKCAVNLLVSKLRAKMCNQNPDDKNDFWEPSNPNQIKDKQGDYLFYPEMTTNGMFVSCGKLNNTFYSGPDVEKYFNEIGYSLASKNDGISNKWYMSPDGLLHRIYGTETNLRLYDVVQIPKSKNVYYPPTRKKVYDDTLISLGTYEKNKLELSSFVVLSWQDLAATEEEFNKF